MEEAPSRGGAGIFAPSPALVDAMAGWFQAEYEALRRFGFVLSGDWHVADDLVQEAFVRICKRPRRVDQEGFPGYARRTMINLWRSFMTRTRLERRAASAPRDEAAFDPEPAERDRVWREIMKLSPQQRAIVALRFYEDMPEAEIASVLGITPGAVKQQMSRAKSKMRAALGEG